MTKVRKAVFISYASQDTQAAAHIDGALRAAGIEVWFDRTELRGGDLWDQRIQSQIRECGLFIALISHNTETRSEGYFRREWRLAIDRMRDLADDEPFLLPVAIDDISEARARVPERFRDVHWTRLAGGEVSPAFIELILQLTGGGQHAVTPARPPPVTVASAPAATTAKRSRWPLSLRASLLLGAGILAVAGAAGWSAKRYLSHSVSPIPYSIEDRRMTFAVLPFQAQEDDPQALKVAKATAEVVTAGLERSTVWAHVVSRQSVQQAVTHVVGVRDLANALHVHFLVRGTVSRTPSGYNVDTLMVDGATERTLGTQTLHVAPDAVMPRWRFDVDDANSDLLLTALEVEVARVADRPVEALDVRDLAFRAYMYWGTHRGLEPKKAYDVATDLLARALAVAPDDRLALYLTARVNLCDCVMAWSQDIEAQKKIGTAALDKYLRIDPWSATALMEKAEIFQLRGQMEEMVTVLEQVRARDPENPLVSLGKAQALFRLGRPAEALALTEPIRDRELYFHANVLALDAAARYALADYETAARLAREAASQMSEDELRQPIDGPVRLLLAAAEAKLGHLDRAAAAMAEFRSSVPQATTITALRSWIYPTSELYGFEPLFDGLRLAGVKD